MNWQDIPIKILFEDDDLLALDKPPGVLTQETLADAQTNLYYAAKRFLITRDQHQYLALHHRLDKQTSGVILFSKTKRGNHILSHAFQNKTVQKTYIAKTVFQEKLSIGDTWKIENHLAPLNKLNKSKIKYQHGSVHSGGQKALTHFEILDVNRDESLLIKATPITGRTHQIRVHLSEHDMSILGDPLYSEHHEQYERLFLHAHKIKLPLNECSIEIKSPLPRSFK